MRIRCTTYFDITATGVKNRFYKSRMPFHDSAGQEISNDVSWNRSRNQQNNWETLNQIIQLRTLTENITEPVKQNDAWEFEFDVADPDAIGTLADPVEFLKRDCVGVPMNIGLDESKTQDSVLKSQGDGANIWFSVI